MEESSIKTIGIVGSRRRNSLADRKLLHGVFESIYEPGDCIVSGGCELGADRFAEDIAKAKGITITIHYPRREQLNKQLLASNPRLAWTEIYYARNGLIAKDCDVLIALVAADRKGGTENTVKTAQQLAKKIVLT